jgi:hypothetical protein
VQNAQTPQQSDYIKAVYFMQPCQTSRKLKKVLQIGLHCAILKEPKPPRARRLTVQARAHGCQNAEQIRQLVSGAKPQKNK